MDVLPSHVALWQDGLQDGREVLGEAPLPARDELHSWSVAKTLDPCLNSRGVGGGVGDGVIDQPGLK